jgi:hypothetical protein
VPHRGLRVGNALADAGRSNCATADMIVSTSSEIPLPLQSPPRFDSHSEVLRRSKAAVVSSASNAEREHPAELGRR